MRRVKLPGNFVQAGSCDKNGRGKQLESSCLRQREFVAFEAAENLLAPHRGEVRPKAAEVQKHRRSRH